LPSASMGSYSGPTTTAASGDPESKRRPERVLQDERKAKNVSPRRRTGPIDGQRCKRRFALKVTYQRRQRVLKPLFVGYCGRCRHCRLIWPDVSALIIGHRVVPPKLMVPGSSHTGVT
jgi:hypothetical protein